MQINKMIAHSSNYTKGRTKKIEFLVIHYTGNNGDTAKSNCNYFKSPNRNASAHYFVDEKEIWQSVEDYDVAWHCGTKGTYYHSKCRNSNAIGIEMCSERDSKGNFYFNEQTINNTIKLTKYLMKKYNISSINNIVRHYDVTHKTCPAPFVNNNVAWNNFKNKLKGEDDEYMHIKANYEYNNKVQSFDVINENGTNYVKVRDIVGLLGKDIRFNQDTKITKIDDKYNKIDVIIDDEENLIQSINSNGRNFVQLRELCEKMGYEVLYDENTKKIKIFNSIPKRRINFFRRK